MPNTKLASDTIRNATIAGAEHLVAVKVAVPLSADLDRVLELLLEEAKRLPDDAMVREPTVYVSQVDQTEAVVTVETAGQEPRRRRPSSPRRSAAASSTGSRAEGIYT